ncbi:MAG: uncharacterized protein JWL86_1935 [Rhizobium sp.]|nr:uncharacterized protein [Rhizobium sp.]
MLFFVFGACAVALTFAAINLMAAKKRLVDHEIDQVIAEKLVTQRDAMTVELLDLRETNGVMRNLLMDIAENEATAKVVNDLPEDVMTRIATNRAARRRELLAEVDAVLRSDQLIDASM